MKLNNKECIVCHKIYSYCPSCQEYKNKPTWMTMFHDENCKMVFDGICAYTLSNDIVKAKEMLSSCDLSVVEKMTQKNIDFVKEIMGYEIGADIKEEDTTTLLLPEIQPIEEEPICELPVVEDENVVEIEKIEKKEVTIEEKEKNVENSQPYKKNFNKNKKRY